MKNRLTWGTGRGQITKEAIVLIQAREGILVLVSREKQSDSRLIFKVEQTGIADGLELRKEKERNQG